VSIVKDVDSVMPGNVHALAVAQMLDDLGLVRKHPEGRTIVCYGRDRDDVSMGAIFTTFVDVWVDDVSAELILSECEYAIDRTPKVQAHGNVTKRKWRCIRISFGPITGWQRTVAGERHPLTRVVSDAYRAMLIGLTWHNTAR
jgi:hypothetical protein